MSALVTGVVVGVVVAIAGAIANGVMNRQRDREQWTRQQERDQAQWTQQMELQTQRWEHEDRTQANQWAHEDELRNHDERLKASVALMAQATGSRLGGALVYEEDPRTALDALWEDMEAADDHVETLGLLASGELYKAAAELRSALRLVRLKNMTAYAEQKEINVEPEPEVEKLLGESDLDTLQREMADAKGAFRNLVRSHAGFRT